MPKFRDVEFPDAATKDAYAIRCTGRSDGSLFVHYIRPGTVVRVGCLTPEQQDELWRRLGEARGHLSPASDKPKPWRDLDIHGE